MQEKIPAPASKNRALIWVGLSLGLCLSAIQVSAQQVTLQRGTYLWNTPYGACAYLKVGRRMQYHLDNDCDGGKDWIAESVTLEGTTIFIDSASLSIESADSTKITGTWRYEGTVHAEFIRQ